MIVSIIPFPQTQLRVARPKRASHEGSILSGCIAWFPCVKADPGNNSKDSYTKPRLLYTWDRYLGIREVVEIPPDKDTGKEVNEWLGEETIIAAQWLLPQVFLSLR